MYLKLKNPDQNPNNTFKVHVGDVGCCEDANTFPVCRYDATLTFAANIASITIDGTAYTLKDDDGVATPASTIALLKNGVRNALAEAGYQDVEKLGLITVDNGGGSYTVQITGQATITKFTTVTPADINFTQKCVEIVYCEYCINAIVGTVADATYDETTEALSTGSYAYTSGNNAANLAVAATFKGDIETAFDTLSVPYESVTVDIDDAAEAYKVTIRAKFKEGNAIQLGSKTFAFNFGCEKTYTTA